jgi:hypothetical protein
MHHRIVIDDGKRLRVRSEACPYCLRARIQAAVRLSWAALAWKLHRDRKPGLSVEEISVLLSGQGRLG